LSLLLIGVYVNCFGSRLWQRVFGLET
jgi:hypothetical protein